MPAFEFLAPDHMIAYGATLAELFENAAYGIAAHAGDGGERTPLYDVPVMAIGDTPEELLSDWLAQLGVRGSEAGLGLVSFVVDRLEEGGVQGSAAGYRLSGPAIRSEWKVETVVGTRDGFWARLSADTGAR